MGQRAHPSFASCITTHTNNQPCNTPQHQGPCQHNFCLACFKRWYAQGKKSCPTCRAAFPPKFAENPRINTVLTMVRAHVVCAWLCVHDRSVCVAWLGEGMGP
jgi:hypothetical protein